MNPGKDCRFSRHVTESLKISPQYGPGSPIRPWISRARRLVRAVEMCGGGVSEEAGRHHVSVVHGNPRRRTFYARRGERLILLYGRKVPKEEFTGKRFYEVMDLFCLSKACKAECPSTVDMAKLKYEFLDHYHRANGLPLRTGSSVASMVKSYRFAACSAL